MTDKELKAILRGKSKNDFLNEETIISAMREAMRLDSIWFGQWLNRNALAYGKDKFIYLIDGRPIYTTDQLYNEYLEYLKTKTK